MLRWWLGEIVNVVGIGASIVRGAARTESGGAVLAFDSGAKATLAFADTTPTPWGFEAGTGENPGIAYTGEAALWLACTEGGIEFPTLRVWSGARSWSETPAMEQIAVAEGVPLVRQLEHFADVIAGQAEPLVSAEDGYRTLAATLQIEAATLPASLVGVSGG